MRARILKPSAGLSEPAPLLFLQLKLKSSLPVGASRDFKQDKIEVCEAHSSDTQKRIGTAKEPAQRCPPTGLLERSERIFNTIPEPVRPT